MIKYRKATLTSEKVLSKTLELNFGNNFLAIKRVKYIYPFEVGKGKIFMGFHFKYTKYCKVSVRELMERGRKVPGYLKLFGKYYPILP